MAEVTFGGQTVAAPPGGFPKNYTVSIPGVATLVINEQVETVNGTYREIRVNALHLIVPGVGEVILSSAKSDINCVPPVSKGPCHDFVSGGGWITAGSGRANFGLNAGFKGGSATPDAHATYIDHGAGLKVKATGIDLYEQAATPTSRRFAGPAEVNGLSDRYEIEVADDGEPGRLDRFRLRLDSGYSATGTLEGGNIQLHKPCP